MYDSILEVCQQLTQSAPPNRRKRQDTKPSGVQDISTLQSSSHAKPASAASKKRKRKRSIKRSQSYSGAIAVPKTKLNLHHTATGLGQTCLPDAVFNAFMLLTDSSQISLRRLRRKSMLLGTPNWKCVKTAVSSLTNNEFHLVEVTSEFNEGCGMMLNFASR